MTWFRSVLPPLVAVALVSAAVVLAPSGAEAPRAPSPVAVTQSTYACPAGPSITVAAGQVTAGSGSTVRVFPDGKDDDLSDAAAWRMSKVDGQAVVVQQAGRSSGAVGFFAGTASKAGGGGLVVAGCTGVTDDAWLLGLGSGAQHFSTVVLTNLADSPAVVDMRLWGPKGEIDAVGANGIVVAPGAVRRVRLDSLAAGEPELAVQVVRRRGSVAVVATDTSTATFQGTEGVTSTASPRRSQVVGGVVKGAGGRALLVLNPGTDTARVDVEVIGPEGTFTPSGLGQVKVGPGRVRAVTVPKSAGRDELALRVTSDQPVATAVRLSPGSKDYAYAEASLPLAGPAVVPVDLGGRTGAPRLVLTAPGKAATVQVEAFDAGMTSLGATSVTVAAGTTKAVNTASKGASYLVVRPRGEVVAAATYADGDGISSLVLAAAPVSVLGPQVRPAN